MFLSTRDNHLHPNRNKKVRNYPRDYPQQTSNKKLRLPGALAPKSLTAPFRIPITWRKNATNTRNFIWLHVCGDWIGRWVQIRFWNEQTWNRFESPRFFKILSSGELGCWDECQCPPGEGGRTVVKKWGAVDYYYRSYTQVNTLMMGHCSKLGHERMSRSITGEINHFRWLINLLARISLLVQRRVSGHCLYCLVEIFGDCNRFGKL